MIEWERARILQWLAGEAGQALLREAENLPLDRLTRLQRLRRTVSAEVAAVIVELLELRKRGRTKFGGSDALYFTPEGLEQATGDAISAYRASRFPQNAPVLDACCGIGGDARLLARRGPILAVDANPAVAVCARLNTRHEVGPVSTGQEASEAHSIPNVATLASYPVRVVCADVTRLDLARLRRGGIEAAFFDPSRRTTDAHGARRRARDSGDYMPPLSWADALTEHFPFVSVKVSPTIDDETLQFWTRQGARVEFLSERGECKEAVLWLGTAGETFPPMPQNFRNLSTYPRLGVENEPISPSPDAAYLATVLRPGAPPATLVPDGKDAFASHTPASPHAILYEPDPAVIRAHLVPTIAAQLDAVPLDPGIAYLTAEKMVSTPFATSYEVLDVLPYNPKALNAWLRAHPHRIEAVKKRGVLFEPQEVKRTLARAEAPDGPPLIIVLSRFRERPFAFLCKPPVRFS